MVARGCPMTPPDSELDALWRDVQERLSASVPDSTYRLWLRAAAGRSAREATTLYLTAPDGIRAWVERRYSA